MPTLSSIQISPGGVPKTQVQTAQITTLGLTGDNQNDKVHHGGPDRAVCLFSLDVISTLRAEGHPITPGSAGENLTLAGLDWAALTPGARLKIGRSVELEITSYTPPCKTIAASFANGAFARILQDKHPGQSRLYARVLTEGEIATGDPVEVLAANG